MLNLKNCLLFIFFINFYFIIGINKIKLVNYLIYLIISRNFLAKINKYLFFILKLLKIL